MPILPLLSILSIYEKHECEVHVANELLITDFNTFHDSRRGSMAQCAK